MKANHARLYTHMHKKSPCLVLIHSQLLKTIGSSSGMMAKKATTRGFWVQETDEARVGVDRWLSSDVDMVVVHLGLRFIGWDDEEAPWCQTS